MEAGADAADAAAAATATTTSPPKNSTGGCGSSRKQQPRNRIGVIGQAMGDDDKVGKRGGWLSSTIYVIA